MLKKSDVNETFTYSNGGMGIALQKLDVNNTEDKSKWTIHLTFHRPSTDNFSSLYYDELVCFEAIQTQGNIKVHSLN